MKVAGTNEPISEPAIVAWLPSSVLTETRRPTDFSDLMSDGLLGLLNNDALVPCRINSIAFAVGQLAVF